VGESSPNQRLGSDPKGGLRGAGPDLNGLPVAFARVLRRSGVSVPVGATVAYARALAAVADRGASGAYWAGRATLVRRPEDVAAYDRAFAVFFGDADPGLRAQRVPVVELLLDVADDDEAAVDDTDEDDEQPPAERRAVRWSPVEVLRAKDLARCTPEELDEAHRLMADLRLRAALRESRRRRRDPRPRTGHRIDLRRTVAVAVRRAGELGRPETTRPGQRRRRTVLLLDVSGSMSTYARALARFAHAAVAGRRRGEVEVFAIGTRLTRITRELATHDPDEALARAAAVVTDWDGGTRLGDGLRAFNDRWGVRGIARGATVVVLSDGWDRGDPEVLAAEVARLSRVVHRLVWVNPLKASPGYAPLARGMAAALPYVDEFVEGHSVDALSALAEVLGRA
jgi:uncharacterized protein with von Willebrand factor type A (vWA) domain